MAVIENPTANRAVLLEGIQALIGVMINQLMERYPMSRRNRGRTRPEYASIGDSSVQDACNTLNQHCQNAMALLTEFPYSVRDVVPMIFDDDAVKRLKAAAGLYHSQSDTYHYDVAGVSLGICFDEEGHMSPPTQMALTLPRAQPLLDFIERVKSTHFQYEEAKGVIRWLNRKGTPGAVRYYFPAIMTLCNSSSVPTDLPSRHTTPPDISDILQPIRDASTLIAAAALMPSDARPRCRRSGTEAMWLSISGRDQPRYPRQLQITDSAVYFF